eukprot:1670355-Rhodomonas_salina.6
MSGSAPGCLSTTQHRSSTPRIFAPLSKSFAPSPIPSPSPPIPDISSPPPPPSCSRLYCEYVVLRHVALYCTGTSHVVLGRSAAVPASGPGEQGPTVGGGSGQNCPMLLGRRLVGAYPRSISESA